MINDFEMKVKGIVENIKLPDISEKIFSLLDFYKNTECKYDWYKAFKDSIDFVSMDRGGKIVVPKGIYIINGPIVLKSGVCIDLEEGAYIRFGNDKNDFLNGEKKHNGCVLTSFEGTLLYNYSPLIYAYNCRNIAITGNGVIDGNGEKVWLPLRDKQISDRKNLQDENNNEVNLENRIYGQGHYLRPPLLSFINCENIMISGLTFKDSGFWMIHPLLCKNVLISNIVLDSKNINSDGIDPESSSDVLIEGVRFFVGDDNIAIKSGRDLEGIKRNIPSSRIVVRNCDFGGLNALSIGSEISGGARDVYIYNCKSKETLVYGILIKTNQNRGGVISNIFFKELIYRRSCSIGIKIDEKYKSQREYDRFPEIKDIYFENIIFEEISDLPLGINGLKEKKIKNIFLKNVIFKRDHFEIDQKEYQLENVQNLVIDNELFFEKDTMY